MYLIEQNNILTQNKAFLQIIGLFTTLDAITGILMINQNPVQNNIFINQTIL